MMLRPMFAAPLARLVAALVVCSFAAGPAVAASADLKSKLLASFAQVKSYRLTVLGSVRSTGVWQAPNRYQMTTDFDGKSVKTVIVGKDLYEFEDGKWQNSGSASNNLDIDIAGLVRSIAHTPSAKVTALPDRTVDGKRVSAFSYAFPDGTDETCDYDPSSYRITRCKTDEVTLLYSGYNDPANKVANVR